MPYLDVICRLRAASQLPIAAYHVSGEYAMLKAAAKNVSAAAAAASVACAGTVTSAQGWLDEKRAVLEAMMSFKRSGASVVLTYYAKQVAQWLSEEGAI